MNKLISIILILFISPLLGQNITLKAEDFNRDCYIDTLRCH